MSSVETPQRSLRNLRLVFLINTPFFLTQGTDFLVTWPGSYGTDFDSEFPDFFSPSKLICVLKKRWTWIVIPIVVLRASSSSLKPHSDSQLQFLVFWLRNYRIIAPLHLPQRGSTQPPKPWNNSVGRDDLPSSALLPPPLSHFTPLLLPLPLGFPLTTDG